MIKLLRWLDKIGKGTVFERPTWQEVDAKHESAVKARMAARGFHRYRWGKGWCGGPAIRRWYRTAKESEAAFRAFEVKLAEHRGMQAAAAAQTKRDGPF